MKKSFQVEVRADWKLLLAFRPIREIVFMAETLDE